MPWAKTIPKWTTSCLSLVRSINSGYVPATLRVSQKPPSPPPGSRCGLAVRCLAGKLKDLGSIRCGSPFSSKIVVYGHCLVTLPTQ